MRSKRFRFGWQFRHFVKGQWGSVKKTGLHFGNIMDLHDGYIRISNSEVIEIRDFLSRYINRYIHEKDMELLIESRKHARAIERNMLKAEAKIK